MRRVAVGAAVALALLGAAGAQRADYRRSPHDVPLTGNGRHLVVEATLNGVVSGPMLVDTGASYCVLTRATARRLGLKPTGTRTVPVATANGHVAADQVALDSVQLRGARLARVDAVIMDAVEPPLIGILGLSFLTHFRFSVDHDAGVLRLER
jgi:clan AA aspartic protease (TIGR02281 family)